MRTLALLLLSACTGAPATPRVAPGVTYEVRLPDARHATKTDLANFVWPRIDPPEGTTPDSEACVWWSGRYAGHDYAKRGLVSGELGWGAVHVTATEVGFDNRTMATLDRGLVPKTQRDALSILPLSAALAEARGRLDRWHEACGVVRRDRPVVVADGDTPNETLGLVLETLSVHRFGQAAMLVADRDPGERKPVDADDPGSFAVIRQLGDQVEALSIDGTRRASGQVNDFESVVATALNGEKYGCTLLAPQALGRWSTVAAILDTAHAYGSRRHLIKPVPPGPERPVEPATGRRPTESLGLEHTAGVLWVDLPDWSRSTGEPLLTCAHPDGFAGARVAAPEPLEIALRSTAAGQVRIDPTLARPALSVAEPVYWGALDFGEPGDRPEAIATLEAALDECVTAARERADAPAQVIVRFAVGPDGRAHTFDLLSPVPEDTVHDCILTAFGALPAFPPLGEHSHAAVVWPVAILPPVE